MDQIDKTTPFDASPEQALDVIGDHDGPILVDFDETLYLRNSTSDFISSARPSMAAFLIVKFLDLLKPWRWTGGNDSRDVWRVRAIMILLPWTLFMWKRKATRTADGALNEPLAQSLRESDCRVVVSTLGFTPIVAPLVQNFGMNGVELIAMNPWTTADRNRGKLAMAEEAIGKDSMSQCAVITDSEKDIDLLNASGAPLRVIWPDAEPVDSFRRLYFPGRYIARVKRPGSNYIRSVIVKEDIALWIVSSAGLATNHLIPHIAGLLLLAVSFWAVYEMGYIDNDRTAAKHEEDPALTKEFHRGKLTVPLWKPFLWAIVAGVSGIFVLRWPDPPVLLDFVEWAGVLLFLWTVYWIYNRIDKDTRIYLFPILQILRTSAFVVLVPILPIAAIAFVIHVVIRWVNYYVYRINRGPWPSSDLSLVRLVTFFVGGVLVVSRGQWGELISTTALLLLGWHLFLARHKLPAVIKSAHRIDR